MEVFSCIELLKPEGVKGLEAADGEDEDDRCEESDVLVVVFHAVHLGEEQANHTVQNGLQENLGSVHHGMT